MIIQGSNQPILIVFGDDIKENVLDLSVSLYTMAGELKHWDMPDLIISGDTAEARLTQEETAVFPAGACHIEIKWLDLDGVTQFNKIVADQIMFRSDKRILEVQDGD